MEEYWLCSVPNVEHVSSDSTVNAIQQVVSARGQLMDIFKLNIPPLHHGTLDSLIALSDEITKVAPQVESVVKKIERQYFDIQADKAAAAAADNATRKSTSNDKDKKPPPLKVQDRTVDAYLQKWAWDVSRFSYQGKRLNELVGQITALACTADEELKQLLAVNTDKTQNLALWQRKRAINMATNDLEDFLSAEAVRAIDYQDNEHLLTVLVALPKLLEGEFLLQYCAQDGNDDGWTKGIACYGRPAAREEKKGSPVVPGSATLVHETEGQVMYAITMLRGHTKPGAAYADPATAAAAGTPGAGNSAGGSGSSGGGGGGGGVFPWATFQPGVWVDYIEPVRQAFRERRCTVRLLRPTAAAPTAVTATAATTGSGSSSSSGSRAVTTEVVSDAGSTAAMLAGWVGGSAGVEQGLSRAQAEWHQSQSTIVRWSSAHFGDVFSALLHLKCIAAFTESVLRYGVPANVTCLLVRPAAGQVAEALSALTDAVLKVRPRLLEEQEAEADDEEGGGAGDANLPYVCLKMFLPTGVDTTA